MNITFKKYQGTGNDFVIISGMSVQIKLSASEISHLCNRRFGIGADGLIIVQPAEDFDFEVVYYNADGSQSFCGNGTRCAVHFAHELGVFEKKTRFTAIDGAHEATIEGDTVALKMADVNTWEVIHSDYVLDTGSPHYIRFVEDLNICDIVEVGRQIRYSDKYKKEGINVNLAAVDNNSLSMLTYERGVEDETYSCGTGATAVVIANFLKNNHLGAFEKEVSVKGGSLTISGEIGKDKVTSIYLKGPAKFVFDGQIEI